MDPSHGSTLYRIHSPNPKRNQMDNQFKDLLLDQEESVLQENIFYNDFLYNNSFHGFWYDSGEKSYGIVLNFRSRAAGMLKLYAQDSNGDISVVKYSIKSEAYSIEPIAYDKVLISFTDFETKLIIPRQGEVEVPEKIEFTLQLLSHHSIYIQFTDYQLFTTPINKLRFGLVLAREINPGSLV
jgi:hypothetical protein